VDGKKHKFINMKKTLFAFVLSVSLLTYGQGLPVSNDNPFLHQATSAPRMVREPAIPDSIVVTKKKILLVSDPALVGDSTFMAIATNNAQFVFTGKKGIITNVSHYKLTKVQGAKDTYVLFSEKKVMIPYKDLPAQAKALFDIVENFTLNSNLGEANIRKLYNTPVSGWKKQKSR